jgi:hypothetical protein
MDEKEIYYASGMTPFEGVKLCYTLSSADCNVALDQRNNVLSLHGVMAREGFGMPWMILSKDAYNKEGIKHAMSVTANWVEDKLQRYKKLQNFISAENTLTIRWLEFLGFKLTKKIDQFGFCKQPFYKFERSL